jgi:Cu(I)/Ag(I) efflux system membrane protein CusA/SilA
MINRIIEFSAKNKFIVFLLVAAAGILGWWSMRQMPLDAIPDLSDTQVIIYSRWDRSPDIVEDQVTYPIVTAMLGAPKVKAVRGFSDFGYSYVYVIFEDGTDIYWARSRTLEYLSTALPRLPQGVRTELGPDATGLGWVFQYALVDTSGKHSLADLRSYQDWYLRNYLKAVPGVAEVAPIGGFTRQYQVNVDPNRLQAYGIPINRVVDAVRGGNNDVGGRMIEFGGTEYMVRGKGYVRSLRDLENIVLTASDSGTPIRIKDIGQVGLGPDIRRGVTDLDGTGDVVSGIVVMRQGENALDVIERVKAKLKEIAPGLPPGVKVVPIYDRSELIQRSIGNLKSTLIEIAVTVALVILLFLWHIPSAIIPIITIPFAVLISFIPFRLMGLTANIMSLGGIAIAVGALVDAAIVVVEQTHKKLEEWNRSDKSEEYQSVIIRAVKEVGGPSFFALLVIAVSFLPVLTLEAQEGRLFKPLAYTKTLAMVVAAVLAITLDPALRLLFTRLHPFAFRPRWLCRTANTALVGTIHPEERHPVSRVLMRVYEPVARWALTWKWTVIGAACAMVLITIPVYQRLGSEFMPPLDEGALFYMPSTMPGIAIGEAQKLLQVTDRIIKQFPEVDRVLGKAGRAETSTDPAPLSMLETVIVLKPTSEWRKVDTWYSSWAPEWAKSVFRRVTPDHLATEDLVSRLNAALQIPGVSNAWTMPIKARIDMLTTGIRTPVGLKISGADLKAIEEVGAQIESLLPQVPGTRSVFAERTGAGFFLDIEWNREALARYGLSIDEAQATVSNAIGGENVTTTIEGRERYPVNVRYLRDFRSDFGALGRVLVAASGGQRQIPLAQLATIQAASGPAMIRNEDGLLTGYVYVDLAGRDPEGYIREADQLLRDKVKLQPGYAFAWSGQYEAMQRVQSRLAVVVPLTLLLVFLLLYMNTRSVTKTCIVALAVPFSAVGAVWFLYLLGYNMSIGVWVGLIALLGVDAETGVFMLLYLDLAYEKAKQEGRLRSLAELQRAILEGAVKRLRPKFMTVATTFLGLVPIMWAVGTGSDVMKRIAAPLIGGILTSFILELVVYPPIYQIWKWREVRRQIGSE